MVPIRLDIQHRKEKVLGAVVQSYIQLSTPVSSSYIVKKYLPGVSSATVRNILAELESEGFLMHPHTSAGRIPTERGYRFYVDHLMNEIQLLEDEKKRIKLAYAKETSELEALLEKTSRLISDATHYTSIVSVDGWDRKLFCQGRNYIVEYPDQQDYQRIANILMALDEKRQVLNILNQELAKRVKVFIGNEIQCEAIESCSLVVSSYKTRAGTTGRIAVLGPTRMKYDKVVSTLKYMSVLLEDVL